MYDNTPPIPPTPPTTIDRDTTTEGNGMYGKLQRYEIYYVVGATWLLQIIWSHIWLRFFRFGPLEWCWRSLTYWKRQPFLK